MNLQPYLNFARQLAYRAGRITLSEGGEVYLAGNTFHVERGSISFANPFRIVPEFDIELRTMVSGTDITLTIDGPLDRLRTDVRSSDPTVDSQIVRLKASGADIFINISTPKFAAQAIKKVAELGWQPVHILNNVSASVAGLVMTRKGTVRPMRRDSDTTFSACSW